MDAAPRLMLIDKQVSPKGHLANAALDNVRVIKYDSEDTTLAELQQMIRTAHYKHGAPFASIACAQHGCDEEGLWTWTSDLVIDLGGGSPLSPMMQLSPIIEALGAALEKTKLGKAHIDLLACGLAAFAPRLVVGLEKLYGIDIRASTDNTGNDVNGGDWKMETDGDYDVAEDYLDRAKLVSYTEVMANNAFERFSKGLKKRWRGMTKKGQATNLERATAKIQAARTKFMEECMYGHSPTSDESERGSCESFHFVARLSYEREDGLPFDFMSFLHEITHEKYVFNFILHAARLLVWYDTNKSWTGLNHENQKNWEYIDDFTNKFWTVQDYGDPPEGLTLEELQAWHRHDEFNLMNYGNGNDVAKFKKAVDKRPRDIHAVMAELQNAYLKQLNLMELGAFKQWIDHKDTAPNWGKEEENLTPIPDYARLWNPRC